MRNEDLIEYVRGHKDPVVTAPEVAEYFSVSNKTARNRLKELEGEDLGSKRVGSSAIAWYALG